MKLRHYFTTAGLGLLLLAGCNDQTQTAPQVSEPQVTGQDVKEDFKQAFRSTKEYAIKSKDEFVAATSRKMDELDAKIDELSKKSADYKDDAKVKADKTLDSLREQRSALGKKFDDVKAASKDAWEQTKDSFADAWDKVEQAFQDAKSDFK